MSDADRQYQEASALHRRGELGQAREAYLLLLKEHPDHARALHRLGNLDLRAGNVANAERLIRRAIEISPQTAGFHNSLGNVLRAAGRDQEALAAYQEELRQRPDFAVAHHQIGLLYLDLGQPEAALKAVQKSIYHAPDFPGGYNTLGRIYNNLGRLDEAGQALRRARHFDPGNAEVHFNLGHVLQRKGDTHAAIESFEAAIRADPEMQRAHRSLARIRLETGDLPQAVEHFRAALKLDPNDASCHFGLGVLFQQRARLDEAKEHFSAALRLDPKYADAHCNLGALHRTAGDFDQARQHYRAALEADPGHLTALAGLAAVLDMEGEYEQARELLHDVATGAGAPADIRVVYATVLERLERREEAIGLLQGAVGDCSDFDRAVLHFKLGDLLDHAGRYDDALAHFVAGNELRQTEFDPDAYRRFAGRIIAAYGHRTMPALARSSSDSEKPIFIVGMPRSGTSLVEQILASHPQVHGAGELTAINRAALTLPQTLQSGTPYPECITELDTDALDVLAGQYLRRLDSLAPQARRVTDKMWKNYEHLGFIAQLFPQARVIHCMRDPRDSLLSCYFHLFGAAGIPFSYDPAHLVAVWDAYRELVRHWRKASPLRMLEVDYEKLASDPETQIPRLIEFAGLPWDAACLEFHRARRAVTTASYRQVSEPMYTRSIGRYRNYRSWVDTHLNKVSKF